MHKTLLFISAALLLTSGLALAEEQIESNPPSGPTRELQNLIFYPHAGQFTASGSVRASIAGPGRVQNQDGAATYTSSSNDDELNGTLAYGIIDRLRVGIAENEIFDQSTKSTSVLTNQSTTYQARGLSNPTLSVVYRALESENSPFFIDTGLSVTPAIGTRKTTAGGQTGNENGGAWNAALQIPIYWIWQKNELGLFLEANRSFGATADGTTPANSSRTQPFWNETVELVDRLHVTNRVYAQGSLVFNLPYQDFTESQSATSTVTEHRVSLRINPTLAVGFLAERWCLLTAALGYSATNTDNDPASGTSSTSMTTQTTATVRGLFSF